jgi:hypothetical protein
MRVRAFGLTFTLVCAVLARATTSRADEDAGSNTAPVATRISLAASAGYVVFHRSTGDPAAVGAIGWAVDLHVHPASVHGFFLGYTNAEAVFGPLVSIIDGGYSWRFFGTRRLEGVTGAGYLDVGPAVGIVSDATPNHTVLGAHVSATLDAHLGFLAVGVVLSYRGGVPAGGPPDAWEGAASSMLRLGAVFDVGGR